MNLDDRMKEYETAESGRRLTRLLPVIARIDGRAFHSFTKDMARPFDPSFMQLMIETTKFLTEETNALVGYTQSDEISLLWHSDNADSSIFFDGRVQKMTSTLAAMASVYFNKRLSVFFPGRSNQMPTFDARVWNVPTKQEAANYFIWREMDAVRNSISMAAQSKFSHNQLLNKSCDEMQEMLWQEHAINWNDYSPSCKRGTYVRKIKSSKKFSAEEIDRLPLKHAARFQPDLLVERSSFVVVNPPPITKLNDRIGFFFDISKTLEECQVEIVSEGGLK